MSRNYVYFPTSAEDQVSYYEDALGSIEDSLGIPDRERDCDPGDRARHIIHNINLWRWRRVDVEPVPDNERVAVLHCDGELPSIGVRDGFRIYTGYVVLFVGDITHWAPLPDREEIEYFSLRPGKFGCEPDLEKFLNPTKENGAE